MIFINFLVKILSGWNFLILLKAKNCGKKSTLLFSRRMIFNSSIIFNWKNQILKLEYLKPTVFGKYKQNF